MAEPDMLFFRFKPEAVPSTAALTELRERQPDITAQWWHPQLLRPFAPGRANPLLWVYSLMHWTGLFATEDYSAIVLRGPDRQLRHVSLVFPRFARFPFMGRNDLQVGATFTRPDSRGHGLALRAVHEILARKARPGRDFWYLTDVDNAASRRVIEKAGFEWVGAGVKRPRFGLKFLGSYVITRLAIEKSS